MADKYDFINNTEPANTKIEVITVVVSTSVHSETHFSLQLVLVEEFQINLDDTPSLIQNISFSTPTIRYFGYNEDSHHDGDVLQVRVNSDDNICALISIQEFTCPVFDTINNVRTHGTYQTMLQSAAFNYDWPIYHHPNENEGHGAYIIFMVLEDDLLCGEQLTDLPYLNRYKNFTLSVTKHVSKKQILIGIGASIGYMTAITLVVVILTVYRSIKEKNQDVEKLMDMLRSSYTRTTSSEGKKEQRDIVSNASSEHLPRDTDGNNLVLRSTNTDMAMNEIDNIHPKNSNDSKLKKEAPKYLIDMSAKSGRGLDSNSTKSMFQKSNLYVYSVLMMGLFYGIPAVQVVINYQNDVKNHGDQDICYFNFLCSIPLGSTMDFNHIFSNIFYMWFGILSWSWLHQNNGDVQR